MELEQAQRISDKAGQYILMLKEFLISQMKIEDDACLDAHIAFSIAVEAFRQALVMQYDEKWRDVIFNAGAKLIPPIIERPINKA